MLLLTTSWFCLKTPSDWYWKILPSLGRGRSPLFAGSGALMLLVKNAWTPRAFKYVTAKLADLPSWRSTLTPACMVYGVRRCELTIYTVAAAPDCSRWRAGRRLVQQKLGLCHMN